MPEAPCVQVAMREIQRSKGLAWGVIAPMMNTPLAVDTAGAHV
jgi:hypothetical protein